MFQLYFLFVEIKSHLIGDVYVEDNADDITQAHPDNPQHGPLKKKENKRWPNGVVPYSFVKEGSTGFSKLFSLQLYEDFLDTTKF